MIDSAIHSSRESNGDQRHSGIRPLALVAFSIAIASSLACIGASAQTSQGFTGTVSDTTGAVIPKAKVKVHNQATGVDKPAVTTNSGTYAVPFLDPGIYTVTAEAAGFKVENKIDITLQTGQTANVSFSLPPGSVTETVTINSSANVLDYEKADRGNVIENKLVEELPVNTGDTFNLATLTPGVSSTTTGTTPGNQSAQTLGIHGASVEFSIDGVTNQSETGPEHYTYAPPVEALQEFKITTNAFDAASGRSPGGQIDMTLKTGTRNLHGAVYEYLQRAFLNANSPVNDAFIALNGPLPIYNKGASTQNQYGFELDGPVIVPRLWGHSRQTFFTILYEDLNNHGSGLATTSVPTPAMVRGDFSGLLNQTVAGKSWNGAIYDPTTEAACTANNTDNSSYSSGHPHVCRYQFGMGPGPTPGPQGNPVQVGALNVIPANRLNPVAQAILSWYPAPNSTPNPTTSNAFNQNYIGIAPGKSDNKTYLIKVDQNVGERDSFNATAKLWKFYAQANNAFPRYDVNSAHPGLNQAVTQPHYNGTDYRYPSLNVSWTHTFTPTMVNIVRGLITSALESDSTGPASGYDPSNLGFSANIGAANPTYFQRFPLTNISSYNALGSQAVLYRGDDALQLLDTVNWTHRNHVIHFGGEVRFAQYSQKSSNNTGLSLSIGNAWSQQWDTNVTGTGSAINSQIGYTNNFSGNSIASMLLGTWDSGSATTSGGNYFSSHYAALYFQDDWKIRPHLTINLGVRWEDPGEGLKDRFNRLNSVFDGTDVNPITQMIPSATLASLPVNNVLLGGVTYAGVAGNPAWEFHHVFYQFGPRAGFAYTANAKTVVRGGIGLFFNDQATGNQNAPKPVRL
ncbi:MAG TPA: TonB-dependent receptor [Acidobacteriaceae bacterium]